MSWFLFSCHQRRLLSRRELLWLLRALRVHDTAGTAADWRTPRWARGSMRRAVFWAICRMAAERPLLLMAGTALALPAIVLEAWRAGAWALHWLGRS